ncbi:MAG: hypothetical protein FJ100_00065 [Deltaproteobacteria bacterium]|nr:hypothetical protein [Deltaproteobacteria bacterium]
MANGGVDAAGSGLVDGALAAGVLQLTVLTAMPALFVGAALSGESPSIAALGAATLRALAALSWVLLGVAPLLVLLEATRTDRHTQTLFGYALLAGAIVALRALAAHLGNGVLGARATWLVWAWALVAVPIGTGLFQQTLGR